MATTLTPANRERLKEVAVSTLTTCLFKRGLRNALVRGVLPVNPAAARMVGEAFTLRFIPAREDLDVMANYASEAHVQRRAVEECPPGHVLVIDAHRDTEAASAGDIMLARLMARGCAGAVTDGGFRDTPDILKLNFPVYHQRPALPSSPIRLHPTDLNQPIGCGGVAVYPADIIVGDAEGVIVIPAHLANEVAEEAAEMTAYETFAAEKVSEGRSIFGLYPATDASRAEYVQWTAKRRAGQA